MKERVFLKANILFCDFCSKEIQLPETIYIDVVGEWFCEECFKDATEWHKSVRNEKLRIEEG